MSITKQIAAFVLAATSATIFAEYRCPGNVESLAYRSLNGHQIVVRVSVNHSGPYNFLLDTGTQITIIDPALARELHLVERGAASVRSGGVNSTAKMAQVDMVEAGSHWVKGLEVVVFGLGIPQGTTLDLRGVLGEDFLSHFDVLIDNSRSMVCMDETGRMTPEVKGRHVDLLGRVGTAGGGLAGPLVVAVKLSDGMRPVNLELDSGASVCFLYNTQAYMALGMFKGVSLRGTGVSGAVRVFTTLPLQTMKVGSVEIPRVPCVTFQEGQNAVESPDFDGLLSTGLFRRVLIAHTNHFAVLEAW
jgi:hypothetical protein